ncbi:MAG: hypothetical protein HQL20_04705 [Candidatus Omnitrophica bacterium]|nr:hypothetical protein [Candidatus Omnitrophota bacterium]
MKTICFFVSILFVFGCFNTLSFAQQVLSDVASISAESTVSEVGKPVFPLELVIKADANYGDQVSSTYRIGEKIAFELRLTNVGKGALKVFRFDGKSIFCDINGQNWGSKEPSGDPVVILMPGEVMLKKFKISGAEEPGDFKVSCTYGMGVNGVRPHAEKTFQIVR